eukprot:Skav225988  [mRNA]  locus=scaffold4003:62095:62316:+ [translate_table: standard]
MGYASGGYGKHAPGALPAVWGSSWKGKLGGAEIDTTADLKCHRKRPTGPQHRGFMLHLISLVTGLVRGLGVDT